jgi:PhoH-like ATPase
MGILQVEALAFIRGRSIPNQIMLLDESQNLSKHEIATIITRAGEGTKIILVGDHNQIDSPYLDADNNGLVHVVNAFKDQKIAAHVTLTSGERSELAEFASKILL